MDLQARHRRTGRTQRFNGRGGLSAAHRMSARIEPAVRKPEMSSLSAFSRRHLGPTPDEAADMARTLGCGSVDDLIDNVIPAGIRLPQSLRLPEALTEEQALQKLKCIMSRNRVLRSFIGLGYHDTFTPPVIQRNILENPGWYTAYTPYQPEISQG